MKQLVLAIIFSICAGSSLSQSLAQDGPVQREVETFERQLTEALAHRDRTSLEHLIADGFTFIHSTGAVETRKDYLDNAVAGNLARQQAEVERFDEPLRIYEGRIAVRVSRRVLRMPGANTENRARHVDVYAKLSGGWQWISGQSTKLPVRPGSANVSPYADSYIGVYEIRANRSYVVSKEAKTLYGVVTGRSKHELIPKSDTEFALFSEDVDYGDDRIVFLKDEAGRVTDAVYRSDGREVWRAKKIK